MKPSKLDLIASFTHHTDLVRSVRGLGKDRIVSISADNTLQCWSWESGDATTNKLQSIAGLLRIYCLLSIHSTVRGSLAAYMIAMESFVVRFLFNLKF